METREVNKITSLVGLTVKLERVKRNWSQEELAFQAKLSKTSIGSIERAISVPSVETVDKIANAFGMSFFEFIDLMKIYNK